MKKFTLLLFSLLLIPFIANSQVTNVKVNGQSSNFTAASGDMLGWSFNVPNAGDSTLVELWVDVNQNGILNPAVDVIWTYFLQIDGDANGQNGPPDADGVANGYVSFQQKLGLAPAHYVLVFKNHNSYTYIAGTITNLASPTFTISGSITVPPAISKQNIMVSLEGENKQNSPFWNALTDVNGNFSIQMGSDTSGNPWRLRTNNNIIFGASIVSPELYKLTITPGTSTYTGNNFTVTAASAEVKGTIKNENGSPMIGADVAIYGDNGNINRRAQSDTVGAFRIGLLASELPQTDLNLYSGDQYDNSIVQAFNLIQSISLGNVLTRNLIIFKTNSTITGRITIDGNSPNYNMQLVATNADTGSSFTNTDLNGNFTFYVSDKIYNYQLGVVNMPFGYTINQVYAHAGQTNVNINLTPTDVKNDNSNVPKSFGLSQNYPNPFNPSTFISYQIPTDAMVTLKIYNVLGNELKTLENGIIPAGSHKVQFNSKGLSSGIYFYSIKAASLDGKHNFTSTKKMILLK